MMASVFYLQLASTPGGGRSELDRIQDLFPADNLGLKNNEPCSQMRMKTLLRKRQTPASRLQRALSAKTLRPVERPLPPPPPPDAGRLGNCQLSDHAEDGGLSRQFIMESAVQFTLALQCQERHLFLFTDMLLVAKPRSGGNFKLKEAVRLSEMWLADCLDEVTEATKDATTSFVMGWPTTNVVATFSSPLSRDLWYRRLSEMIAEERRTEPQTTTIQVLHYDNNSDNDTCKTLSVDPWTSARECVVACVEALGPSSAGGARNPADYELWAMVGAEDAPYPLIGHELPAAIKLNFVRDLLSERRAQMDHCSGVHRTDATLKCHFILRYVRKSYRSPVTEPGQKKRRVLRRSPIRIHRVFRRGAAWRSGSVDSAIDSTCSSGSNGSTATPGGALYGQPLDKLCQPDGTLPHPVLDMLTTLYTRGPFTVGIFRKSANARVVKETKEKLDNSEHVDMSAMNIYVVAGLLKDFLRSLPEPLVSPQLCSQWTSVSEQADQQEKINRAKLLWSRLPASSASLLRHFICVLHHIARRSEHNLMCAANLAVCVAPSLLARGALTSDTSRRLAGIVQLLVEQCDAILGGDCSGLLERLTSERQGRPDSRTEQSDSAHSSGGVRRDDSSVDSLDGELAVDGGPLVRRDKLSASSLSRDSGLTLSDSQLYSGDSGRGSAQPSPCERAGFQRHDWRRQPQPARRPSRPDPEELRLRRSASEESVLNGDAAGDWRGAAPEQVVTAQYRPPAVTSAAWLRSRSSPHIDQLERWHDSSTLSDADSTPQVSRSSSRGRDCDLARGCSTLDNRGRGRDPLRRRPGPDGGLGRSRDGYYTLDGGRPRLPEQLVRQQTALSDRARRLYQESLRLYQQQQLERASPPPPPLPPKQRPPTGRRSRRLPQPEPLYVQYPGRGQETPPALPPKERPCRRHQQPRPPLRLRRRVSRREAQTQTESPASSPAACRLVRPRHITLVEIEAAGPAEPPAPVGPAGRHWRDAADSEPEWDVCSGNLQVYRRSHSAASRHRHRSSSADSCGQESYV